MNRLKLYRAMITTGLVLVVLSTLASLLIKTFIENTALSTLLIALSFVFLLLPGVILAVLFAFKLGKRAKIEYAEFKSEVPLYAELEFSQAEKMYYNLIKSQGDFHRFLAQNRQDLELFCENPSSVQKFIIGSKEEGQSRQYIDFYLDEICRMADYGENKPFAHVEKQAVKSAFVKNLAEAIGKEYADRPAASAAEEIYNYKQGDNKSAEIALKLFYYLWVNGTLSPSLESAYQRFYQLYGNPLEHVSQKAQKAEDTLLSFEGMTEEKILEMNELEFDHFVAALFQKKGGTIVQSSMYNPSHIDFIIEEGGERTAVLSVASTRAGKNYLQNLLRDMAEKRVSKGILITAEKAESSLKNKAKKCNVIVLDARDLMSLYRDQCNV